MRLVTSVAAMQRLARQWSRADTRIGFVPTMGFLHAGHVSLMQRARREIGARGKLVVSIYVNPAQFGPKEDFSRYPRDLDRDLKLCRAAGADAVFTPSDAQMYPGRGGASRKPGRQNTDPTRTGHGTYVVEEELSQSMEGSSRPGHFRGVTTVVAKLFNLVQPDIAVFGAKDWQQAAVIKRMVRDLHFPVRIIITPTMRARDGLAMSSRNKYLTGNLRRQATVLWCAIQTARAAVKKSRTIPAAKLKVSLKKLIEAEPDARLDYIEFFEPDSFLQVTKVTPGTHLALAVFVGKTRLIDNARLY